MSHPNSSSTSNVNSSNMGSTGEASARELYESTGDAAAALKLIQSRSSDAGIGSMSPAETYNLTLLEAAASQDSQGGRSLSSLWSRLEEVEGRVNKAYSSSRGNSSTSTTSPTRKRRREELTLTYNRGLLLLARDEPDSSIQLLWETLHSIVAPHPQRSKLSKELLRIACRMGLLLLESILSLAVASTTGIPRSLSFLNLRSPFHMEEFLEWLQQSIDQLQTEDPQLKFLLSLYMARLDLGERDWQGKMVESNIRSARKELKQAMEIFQHKLRQNTDSASLASSSVADTIHTDPAIASSSSTTLNVAATSGQTPLDASQPTHSQANQLTTVLQNQSQAALSLKANSEQLKGNGKKSLILCSEAQSAVSEDALGTREQYQGIHFNNLGVVYQTHGKPHLALHAWSKAVDQLSSATVQADGTARLNHSFQVLHNAAIGSLQAQRFLPAYECMGTCLQNGPPAIWSSRPRCWLRLSEACIGLWADIQKKKKGKPKPKKQAPAATPTNHPFSAVEVDGTIKGIVLNSTSCPQRMELAPIIAGPSDMEQIQTNPLPRARMALEQALKLLSEQQHQDVFGVVSAKLSMSYVCLEELDYKAALKFAKLVLEHSRPGDGLDAASLTLHKRQQATARMYASEASCAIGDAVLSMKYLVGDGEGDAFDRLASALGGVTIETAASLGGTEGKTRLAKAQAMVRCSASAASATMGNLPAARQLAMSAQAMEDAYSSSREGSSARRALVYCMLREGNCGAALTLLRSAR